MDTIENSIGELRRALDVSHVRNRVIAENIANSETPGFKGSAVDFKTAMSEAERSSGLGLAKTSAMHMAPAGSDAGVRVEKSDNPARADGNNVDRNMEMAELAENTIVYNTAAELLNRKIRLLKFAIEEGGK